MTTINGDDGDNFLPGTADSDVAKVIGSLASLAQSIWVVSASMLIEITVIPLPPLNSVAHWSR